MTSLAAPLAPRDDLAEGRCGPLSVYGELRFRHEHDLNNTPGYRDSVLCRRTEAALAKVQPKTVPFRLLLNGEAFQFKQDGNVFLRDKTFFRTLSDSDNGQAYAADMNAIVFPYAPALLPERIPLESDASLRKVHGHAWGFFRGDSLLRYLSEFEVQHLEVAYRAGHAAGVMATHQ